MGKIHQFVGLVPWLVLSAGFTWAQESSKAQIQQGQSPVTESNYKVFRGDGTPATLDDLLKASRAVSVTFLGESHDDPVAHFLEARILESLAGPKTVLAMEMFDRDAQPVLDEYLKGSITEKYLISDGRAWKNYETDYRPLIEIAKEKHLPVIAGNAPDRYVNRVSRLGKDSLKELDPEVRTMLLPPLPYADASKAYLDQFQRIQKEMMDEAMAEFHKEEAEKAAKSDQHKPGEAKPVETAQKADTPLKGHGGDGHNMGFAMQAQSLWDATMADSIARRLKQRPDSLIVHVNGSFHSQNRLGILDHLAKYRPNTKSIVVTMISAKSFPNWDKAKMEGQGDFVIVTDPSLPRSFGDTPAVSAGTKEASKNPAKDSK